MQSWKALLLAGMLIGPVLGSPVAFASTPDVEAVVDDAYAQWEGALGIRSQCSAGVSIVYQQIDGRRGEYRTGTQEVVVDPTDSLNGMGAIVVHELAHHTFLACGAFADQDFKTAFYAAQDLPEGRDWFDYAAGWSATPAEHFAEAMAVTVYGSGEGGIAVSAEASAIITRWLAGAPTTPPAPSYEPVPYSAETGLPVDDGAAVSDGPGPVAAEPAPLTKPPALYISAVELVTRASVSVFSLTTMVLGPQPV